MRTHHRDVYEWSDDGETATTRGGSFLVMAGLPPTWSHYGWWISGLAYAALWIVDRWTAGETMPGLDGATHLPRSLGGLVAILGLCSVIFYVSRKRFERLGFTVCTFIGLVALMAG
jgi:hypothetical protein